MFCILIHPFLLGGNAEPNLSYHTCRFVVFISSFAKPISLYLTLVFSIERLITKVLLNLILRTNKHRFLLKIFYLVFIGIVIGCILSIRLYEILTLIKKDQLISNNNNNNISRQDMINSTDRILDFQYCYRSINIQIYAQILSFYVVQYSIDYVLLGIISLILLSIIINQYCLPRFQQRSSVQLSVNTIFYLSLSSCVILFELVLLSLHAIVDKDENNNTDTQVNYLQTMLFVYNFRCILLPLIICLTTCNPLKECLYEFFIQHRYTDQINENDQSETFTKNDEHFDL
jgi:hypothetical protein